MLSLNTNKYTNLGWCIKIDNVLKNSNNSIFYNQKQKTEKTYRCLKHKNKNMKCSGKSNRVETQRNSFQYKFRRFICKNEIKMKLEKTRWHRSKVS